MGGDLLQVISTNYPHHRTARARLARLSDERRLEIEQGFERHKRACRSLGIKPDPQWVVEALMETEAERK